ncbi:unnamed protein product [Microthlaspi erraticum]|uniref:Uncharacterized protein n=1 Tax=Microthlaspi erraticum TaxID=1685480 RepID=A0A6D2HG49_9BRAS|nr:unnamed protein product [Microthlaspi erraticum]
MGREEHGRTWRMDAAQLDTQRKKEEAILKTSSTIYSTNRSSSSTRPAKLQLDRAEKCMRTRSSRSTEDLVELDFTTGRKRVQSSQRVQEEPEDAIKLRLFPMSLLTKLTNGRRACPMAQSPLGMNARRPFLLSFSPPVAQPS